MNDTIMGFSNQEFYENKLFSHPTVSNRILNTQEHISHPLEFIDTAGCGFDEKTNPETLSLYNDGELEIIKAHWKQLEQNLEQANPPSVAIISPYREQVRVLENYFYSTGVFPGQINTVDAFQGQERDIIYISLVRSNEKGDIGFLNDYRRMNVALTRAKKKLIVIGDSSTLGFHKFYESFLRYCEKKNAYRSAWEFLYSK
jgi:superfamily I DNA and/or RNA helicase